MLFHILTTLTLALAVAAVPNPQESHSIDPTTTLPSTASTAAPTLTGAFTANGGEYDVTSLSGYVLVAGHTLTPGGPNALVGGVIVTEASGGFVANGQTVRLATYTSTAVSTTAASSTASTTTRGPAGQSPAATSVASSTGLAAPTGVPRAGAAAVLGGVMGLLML